MITSSKNIFTRSNHNASARLYLFKSIFLILCQRSCSRWRNCCCISGRSPFPAVQEGKRIYLVLDNAPWHKKAVRLVQTEALEAYQDIRDKLTLLFLPPYSPVLNPIEQCWRITRREMTHNTYYANKNEFEKSLDDYYAQYREPNEKFSSLCSFEYKN